MSAPKPLSAVFLILLILLTGTSCKSSAPAQKDTAQKPLESAPAVRKTDPTQDFQDCYPVSKLPMTNPGLPREAVRAQKERIAADLPVFRQRVKTLRKDRALEERFQRIWLEKQKQFQLLPKVISPENGQEIERFQNRFRWLRRKDILYALPDQTVFTEEVEASRNIRALHTLHELLKKCHIQLLVVLIPDANQIARSVFLPETSHIGDPVSLQCAAVLLEYGIETIYPDEDVLAASQHSPWQLFCYPHPQPEAGLWKILADLAARRMERFGKNAFVEPAGPSHFAERLLRTAYGQNYRWPENVDCQPHQNGETVESLAVFRNGTPFQPDPKSKILVIGGDTLNLPGPGHTFSGQLSLRLHYPVDELVPGGEVWFQNLASALSRDPVRYLAGKQVCLLMISPRMLAGHVFPDLTEQTELANRLSRSRPVHSFPLVKNETDFRPADPLPADRLAKSKRQWNGQWLKLSKAKDTAVIRIEDEGKPTGLMNVKVPGNLSKQPLILFLRAAGYPGQSNTLLVNGQPVPLLNNTTRTVFQPAAVALPAGTTELKLEFTGSRDNLILIRNVELYQEGPDA
ncbi:MAG: hypothetical protein J5806_00850 [Lentisphaeria bacterium]|nr:hypothetical protein [Lentisphaeria bacterium]